MLRSLLEEQRMRSEHLEEQLNDMMELHQHEITDIKQVVEWKLELLNFLSDIVMLQLSLEFYK